MFSIQGRVKESGNKIDVKCRFAYGWKLTLMCFLSINSHGRGAGDDGFGDAYGGGGSGGGGRSAKVTSIFKDARNMTAVLGDVVRG